MAELFLKVGVYLESADEFGSVYAAHGPIFNRWLPNGEVDALLSCPDENTEIKLWFERRGYKEGAFIRYDLERKEVDPSIMERQEVLQAGPLVGRVTLKNLNDAKLKPIIENTKGDPQYMALGRKIAFLLYDRVSRLISILRTCYGQYWIRPLEKWDEREEMLGSYCSRLGLMWSLDDKDWKFFRPNLTRVEVTGRVGPFPDYLQEQDWKEVKDLWEQGFEPASAAHLLSQTHRLLEEGELRYALIEAVSAAETAIGEYMKRKTGTASKAVKKSLQSFYDLPLPAQLVTTVGTLPGVSQTDLELALTAIKTRNTIVHEASPPPPSAKNELKALMKMVAMLLPGPKFRFPVFPTFNSLAPLKSP